MPSVHFGELCHIVTSYSPYMLNLGDIEQCWIIDREH